MKEKEKEEGRRRRIRLRQKQVQPSDRLHISTFFISLKAVSHRLTTLSVFVCWSRPDDMSFLMTSRFDIDIVIARHIPTSFDIVPTRCRHDPT